MSSLLSGVAACGATDDQLRARAAFDLDCAQSKLTLVEIDERTQGVKGCGQKVTYVQNCQPGVMGVRECTWILNTDSKKTKTSSDDQ